MRARSKPNRETTAVDSVVVLAFAIALLSLSPSPAFASVAEMYYSMGQEYVEKGNFDMAVLAFEKAVEQAPDWPEAHNALGEAYIELLRFEDAVAEFDKAIELKSDYTQAKLNRRRTMMSLERYKPMEGSRLSNWQKISILGAITAAIAAIAALIVHSLG
jgi:tetratricopeptide (TPR) repeat protein